MGEPLNHIYQDTKSAWLIAVCKRSFTVFIGRPPWYNLQGQLKEAFIIGKWLSKLQL